MKRILIVIEYDGTNYKGWQQQKDYATVQQTLTEALIVTCGHDLTVHASGRTDDGVHAIAQTAHFDTTCTIPPERIAAAVNTKLPDDIKVLKSFEVSLDFHARFSAKRKTYVYKFYTAKVFSPLKRFHYTLVPQQLNIEAMKKACEYLEGTHDFAAFKSTFCKLSNTVRTMYSAKIVNYENIIEFHVCGNGFLQHMVRILAGTLLEVGKEKYPPEFVKEIILKKDRSLAGKTCEPQGLYLKEVEYVVKEQN